MKKLVMVVLLGVGLVAGAAEQNGRNRHPAQSGMTLNGGVSMSSYPNQLVIELDGDKAAQLFERVAKKKTKAEVSSTAKVWCDSATSCSVYWDQ